MRNIPLALMVTAADVKNGLPQIPGLLISQAESLKRLGWEVVIGNVDDRTTPQGIWRNVRQLRQLVAQFNPQVIHAQYGSVNAAVAQMAAGKRPFVVSFCGDDLLGTPMPGWLWRIRERLARWIGLWAAHRATGVIVKSHNLYQALPDDLKARAVLLPNGVNLDVFKPLAQQTARDRLGWARDGRVVLFNGSRTSNQAVKNLALADQTIDILKILIPDAELRVVSDIPFDEMVWVFNAANCLLVTSLHEGSPNIVKEAMACNLPVVSVPCGDVRERLDDVYPSAVCSYNPQQLADALANVIQSERRSNGRVRLIEQGLDTESVACHLVELYERVSVRSD
jgi:glycosyltransferase involved in cell wall biosynthesis